MSSSSPQRSKGDIEADREERHQGPIHQPENNQEDIQNQDNNLWIHFKLERMLLVMNAAGNKDTQKLNSGTLQVAVPFHQMIYLSVLDIFIANVQELLYNLLVLAKNKNRAISSQCR